VPSKPGDWYFRRTTRQPSKSLIKEWLVGLGVQMRLLVLHTRTPRNQNCCLSQGAIDKVPACPLDLSAWGLTGETWRWGTAYVTSVAYVTNVSVVDDGPNEQDQQAPTEELQHGQVGAFNGLLQLEARCLYFILLLVHLPLTPSYCYHRYQDPFWDTGSRHLARDRNDLRKRRVHASNI
jgi:hypothetical protein